VAAEPLEERPVKQSDPTPSERAQDDLIAAIASGAATGDSQPLRRLDTHMSRVFLAPGRVYKLKRSLRHPFCDMTSLEARRLACEAELAVNQTLAPDLYEAVLPVTRTPEGAVRIDGNGKVVDWVVAMRRFPNGALLRDMADAGHLEAVLIRDAVTAVAGFHAGQAAVSEAGHAVDYRRIIAGLRDTEAAGAAELGMTPASAPLFDALERELARVAPRIEARRRNGWVRRGHGDLHLANICVFQEKITPYDALEFDPALATADVIYDIAFLLMDLRARGLDSLANEAMNHYWNTLDQPEEALALLPFFMALRAAVRMAVSVEAGALADAARYRSLSRELLHPSKPILLAVGGLSGAGKSTLAASIAPELPGVCGARVLRTDALRRSDAQLGVGERLDPGAYQHQGRARIYRLLAERAREALHAHTSVVADGTFQEDTARAAIEGVAHDADFLAFWLDVPAQTRIVRVAQRRGDISDATPEIALHQVEPAHLGEAWRRIVADGAAEALTTVRQHLANRLDPRQGDARFVLHAAAQDGVTA